MPELDLFRSLGVASVAGGRMEGLVLVRDGRLGASWFVGRRLPYWHTSRQAGYPVTCGLSLQAPMPMVNARCKSRLRRDFATQQRRNFSENFNEDGEGTTAGQRSAISRLESPRLYMNLVPPGRREQGMPGARCTRGLVCNGAREVAHTSIQVQSEHSGIPCAMALRLMPRSPRSRIPLASVVGELAAGQARLS